MNCEHNEAYALGRLKQDAYQRHRQTCPTCQTIEAKDAELQSLFAEMNDAVPAPPPFERLRPQLQASARIIPFHRRPLPLLLAAAAMLLLTFTLGWQLGRDGDVGPGLLDRDLIADLIQQEETYLAGIERLEEQVAGPLGAMDTELRGLYEQRLALIDQQILDVRRALDENPANAHLRRYLLAALVDKRATLGEVIDAKLMQSAPPEPQGDDA